MAPRLRIGGLLKKKDEIMKLTEVEPRIEELTNRLITLQKCFEAHTRSPVDDAHVEAVDPASMDPPAALPKPEVEPEVEPEAEATEARVPEASEETVEASDPPIAETPEEEEVDIDFERFHKETESAATPAEVASVDLDLSAVIAQDVKPYKIVEVINAAMNHPKLRNARELVMKPETGQMEKVQSFRLTDGTFMVPSREVFERVVAETKIDEVEWVKDVTDCEDISLRFNARCIELGLNSCGRVMSWSGGHCFIIAIVRDGDSLGFAFLEPQTDQFLTDEVGEGQYSLENCLILIN